jgi:hypothetical protein
VADANHDNSVGQSDEKDEVFAEPAHAVGAQVDQREVGRAPARADIRMLGEELAGNLTAS